MGYRQIPQLEDRRDPLIHIGHVRRRVHSDARPRPDPLFKRHELNPIGHPDAAGRSDAGRRAVSNPIDKWNAVSVANDMAPGPRRALRNVSNGTLRGQRASAVGSGRFTLEYVEGPALARGSDRVRFDGAARGQRRSPRSKPMLGSPPLSASEFGPGRPRDRRLGAASQSPRSRGRQKRALLGKQSAARTPRSGPAGR